MDMFIFHICLFPQIFKCFRSGLAIYNAGPDRKHVKTKSAGPEIPVRPKQKISRSEIVAGTLFRHRTRNVTRVPVGCGAAYAKKQYSKDDLFNDLHR